MADSRLAGSRSADPGRPPRPMRAWGAPGRSAASRWCTREALGVLPGLGGQLPGSGNPARGWALRRESRAFPARGTCLCVRPCRLAAPGDTPLGGGRPSRVTLADNAPHRNPKGNQPFRRAAASRALRVRHSSLPAGAVAGRARAVVAQARALVGEAWRVQGVVRRPSLKGSRQNLSALARHRSGGRSSALAADVRSQPQPQPQPWLRLRSHWRSRLRVAVVWAVVGRCPCCCGRRLPPPTICDERGMP